MNEESDRSDEYLLTITFTRMKVYTNDIFTYNVHIYKSITNTIQQAEQVHSSRKLTLHSVQ